MAITNESKEALHLLAGRLSIWHSTSPWHHPHDLRAAKAAVEGIDPSDRNEVLEVLIEHGLSVEHASEVADLI